MPKPKTKEELLSVSKLNFEKLKQQIEHYTPEEQEALFTPGFLNKNIRDVLAHLHHWHLMMLDWYEVGMAGKKPDMPAKGYTWRTTSELNKWIWQHYQETELHDIKEKLQRSYKAVRAIIKKHSHEELFEKKRYPWTGSTSLGAYLTSATSSHYDWAFKLIKKAKK